MNFSGPKNKLIIGFIFALLVFFCVNFFQKDIRSFSYNISSPIQRFFWGAGNSCSNFFASIIWVNNLKKDKDDLNLKNQELLAKLANFEELQKENETLKSALAVDIHKDFNLVITQVISKDIGQDFILLDKGKNCGMEKNMPVITAQKVLVGKVSEVFDNYSKVMLISDKDCSFDARIKEKDISGIVKGRGNSNILFDLIPQDKEVSKDDVVVSSSLAGFFPANLLVGKISNIKRNDVEAFQQAEINPAFDTKDIDYLFVITSNR